MSNIYEKAKALLLEAGFIHAYNLKALLGLDTQTTETLLRELVQEGLGISVYADYHFRTEDPEEVGHPCMFYDPEVSAFVIGPRCPVCGEEIKEGGRETGVWCIFTPEQWEKTKQEWFGTDKNLT